MPLFDVHLALVRVWGCCSHNDEMRMLTYRLDVKDKTVWALEDSVWARICSPTSPLSFGMSLVDPRVKLMPHVQQQ